MEELLDMHGCGVFLRRDALANGYLDRDLSRALRAGELVRVRQGAYTKASTWEQADAGARHAIASRAVLLTHQGNVALSHVSGAIHHGMSVWGLDLSQVHLTRVGSSMSRRHHNVAYHDAPGVMEVQMVDRAPALSPAVCAVGAATLGSVEAGMVVVDSAYNLGLCTENDVKAALDLMSGWANTGKLRVTLPLAQPGSESVGESRSRFLFWRYHFPRPVLQYPVYDGDELIGITDFAWPELGVLGEFDGRVKYGRLVPAGESPGDVVYREKIREDRLREITGWRMVRLTWFDLERPDRTADRLTNFLGPRRWTARF